MRCITLILRQDEEIQNDVVDRSEVIEVERLSNFNFKGSG